MKPVGGLTRCLEGCGVVSLLFLGGGCSSESDVVTAPPQDARLAVACEDSPDSFYQRPTGLPAFGPERRGDVVRCGPYGTFGLEALKTAATTLGYTGALTSGVTAYRIAYRTERAARADGTKPEGVASATLFLPDTPRASAGEMPLVVVAHGTIGIGERCAPSRGELTVLGAHLDDYRSMVIPLIASGWVVVAPDYPGYGYGETTGYLLAEDAAHGVLDATRAAAKVLSGGMLSGKVVIVGHSQGGHAALSAHSFAPSYGMEGTLVGVLGMAPLWFTPLAFAAMISPFAGFTTKDDPYPLSYALAYFYTHGEILDGPGHGLDMFLPEKRDMVRDIATNDCLFEAAEHMPSLGETPSDFFEKEFVDSVGLCGVTGTCTKGDALVWGARCRTDRPPIDPHGAPIVLWHGGLDKTITPGLAVCGIDNLREGLSAVPDATTAVRVCVDPTATHSGFLDDAEAVLPAGITRRAMAWTDQWIAARTIGGAEPEACEGEEAFSEDSEPVTCTVPPPND